MVLLKCDPIGSCKVLLERPSKKKDGKPTLGGGKAPPSGRGFWGGVQLDKEKVQCKLLSPTATFYSSFCACGQYSLVLPAGWVGAYPDWGGAEGDVKIQSLRASFLFFMTHRSYAIANSSESSVPIWMRSSPACSLTPIIR